MARRRWFGKKILKALLPILLIVVVAAGVALSYIVYNITRPPNQPLLVTPQAFKTISGTVLKVTDETWTNRDGTSARGWLLRGKSGGPAVIFLHKYGADRSWLFNLGLKLNETAGYTILWPDLRGHGQNPPVKATTFGTQETDDLLAAIDFLRGLRGEEQARLIGERLGVYGVELGAYAATRAATMEPTIQALVLDSVPRTDDELVAAAVKSEVGMTNRPLLSLTRTALKVYLIGRYQPRSTCEMAATLKTPKVLLLAGADDDYLRQSTNDVARCFPTPSNLEVKTDLPLTGFTLPFAPGEQGEAYDRPVIEFFVTSLN